MHYLVVIVKQRGVLFVGVLRKRRHHTGRPMSSHEPVDVCFPDNRNDMHHVPGQVPYYIEKGEKPKRASLFDTRLNRGEILLENFVLARLFPVEP